MEEIIISLKEGKMQEHILKENDIIEIKKNISNISEEDKFKLLITYIIKSNQYNEDSNFYYDKFNSNLYQTLLIVHNNLYKDSYYDAVFVKYSNTYKKTEQDDLIDELKKVQNSCLSLNIPNKEKEQLQIRKAKVIVLLNKEQNIEQNTDDVSYLTVNKLINLIEEKMK